MPEKERPLPGKTLSPQDAEKFRELLTSQLLSLLGDAAQVSEYEDDQAHGVPLEEATTWEPPFSSERSPVSQQEADHNVRQEACHVPSIALGICNLMTVTQQPQFTEATISVDHGSSPQP
jgi:hypothetical protein